MMFQEKVGVRSVRFALGLLTGLMAGHAMAQEPIQRVEITGSSIKRIAVEGALPVQRLSAEVIAKTGATNVAELLQSLPAMQGFTITATAAGTNSGGRASASIHDLGESYTLVLLNGRRLAPQGSGSAVNLQAIPMSAVDYVEILTDGASALYGSDAIAGVVNFKLKENKQGGDIDATYHSPTESTSGATKTLSATYGFGDVNSQGFNVLVSYRHDEQSQLKATERDFSKTAYIPFSRNGNNYVYDRTSTATVPANVGVTFNNSAESLSFSPYLKKNGKCPELNFVSLNNSATTQNCAFDFAATVETVPENKRDTLFLKGALKVGQDFELFSDVVYSRFDLTARIAPNTAPFTIVKDSPYYNDNVKPYLSATQQANVKAISGNYRTYDWGTRDSRTVTEATHFVVGGKGDVAGFNLDSALTWSRNAIEESYVGGYALNKEFRDMLTNRSFDPFAPIGAQSPATQELINKSIFHGTIREASTTLKVLEAHGSHDLFQLPGGAAVLALGGDFRQTHYEQTASADSKAGLIYNFNASPEYDLKRETYGAFAELQMPVVKQLEVTLSMRYDSISAVKNGITSTTMGKDASKSTYKVSAVFKPTSSLMFRGSYGTGFKAPSMLDIGQPLVNNGFTASSWNCPFPTGEGAQYCRPGTGKTQYNQMSGGNVNLRPETSKQFTVGMRFEPSRLFSAGLDLWDVKMVDAVSSVSQQLAFGDPAKYRNLFSLYKEPSTGNTYWAYDSIALNIGKTHNRGIDWDFSSRKKFGFGTLSGAINGTHLLKSNYTKPGTDSDWTNSLNVFGVNDAVSFRDLWRMTGSLETGALTNTLTVNFRNGYADANTSVRNVGTGKDETLRLEVPSYTTLDWQGRYVYNKALSVRIGIKNLLNEEPPLSLRASSGHQVGYDPRYAEPLGRQAYLTANYKF